MVRNVSCNHGTTGCAVTEGGSTPLHLRFHIITAREGDHHDIADGVPQQKD